MSESQKFFLSDLRIQAESVKYKILSNQYINTHSKLEFLCPEQHCFEMSWNSFKRGQRCPICCGNQKHNIEVLKNICADLNFTIISSGYKNSKTKLEFQCPNGHNFYRCWDKFRINKKCPQCQNTKKFTQEEKISFLNSKNITFNDCGEIGYKQKQQFICQMGHNFLTSFAMLRRNHYCSECNKYKPKSYQHVKNFIESFDDYKLLSEEFIHSHEKLLIECPKGHIYGVTFSNFQKGTRCPRCNQSKGELRIAQILTHFKVHFEKEFRFKNCKKIRPLPFDFYLPSMKLAIEFHGEQHFKPINWFGGPEKFKSLQQNDQIKRDYCKSNSIKLLEISYEDFYNLDTILSQALILPD